MAVRHSLTAALFHDVSLPLRPRRQRILGADPGSLQLVDGATLRAWHA
jgi:hypothetical protein